MHGAAANDPRIHFTGGIYDQELLDQLYGNATTYIHGHSVGGTNPSLLRAMGAGAAVLAYEVEFNREVTNNQALFWSDADALTTLFNEIATGSKDQELADLKAKSQQRILEHYQWDQVTDQYETLIKKLYDSKKNTSKNEGAKK